jgi:hypothetical protein
MRFATIISLVVVGVISRLIPHWPNFTPVLAAALFAGVYIKDKRIAFLVPLLTMAISDLFLPFHQMIFFNYGAMALVVLMGTYIKKVNFGNVFAASLAGSVAFFLITNFGSWVVDPFNIYANNLAGLGACYAAALPFAAHQVLPGATSFATNTLWSDLFFNAIFFGGFAIAQYRIPQLKAIRVKS